MRQNVRQAMSGVVILVCLGLSSTAVAQDEMRDFYKRIEAKVKAIEDWENGELKRLTFDVEAQTAKLREILGMAEGVGLANDNEYRQAMTKWKGAVENFKKIPEAKRTPQQKCLHLAALLELGRILAIMAERDQAHETILEAADALAKLDERQSENEPLRLRAGCTIATVLCAVERPEKAVDYVDKALARCEEYVRTQPTPDRQALLAACRLAKAEVARAIGDPNAEALAKKALDSLETHATNGERAVAIYGVGAARFEKGDAGAALTMLREADTLLTREFPNGNPAQAALALTLAATYARLGESQLAPEQVERSRSIWEHMFPTEKFPKGHPGLILALLNVGDVHHQMGHKDRALAAHLKAWELSQAYYRDDHENKMLAMIRYGHSLRVSRSPGQSPSDHLKMFAEAIAMGGRLYGRTGHPNLAQARVHLGTALAQIGQTSAALKQLEAADLYYRDRYPAGHPHAAILAQLRGVMYRKLGDRDRATALFKEALDLDRRLLQESTRGAADAEAFALGQRHQLSYQVFLSASRDLPATEQERVYEGAWHAKGAVSRLLAERLAVRRLEAGKSPESVRLWDELRAIESRLARLRLDSLENPSVRDEMLNSLGLRKAELQRELSLRLPGFRGEDEAGRLGPDAVAPLLKREGGDSAFVDFIQYRDIMAGPDAAPRYVAFVIKPGSGPIRVELGPATTIDKAVESWREQVTLWNPKSSSAARRQVEEATEKEGLKLRRLVWEPIAAHFPTGTSRLYLALDGALAGLPFAALPGSKPRTALVEDYVLARVPHGPFLLEALKRRPPQAEGAGTFLALGNVEFDSPRDRLPGSVDAMRLAEKAARTRPTIKLQSRAATPQALSEKLPQAVDALIETHAFYLAELRLAEEELRNTFIRDWPPSEGLAAPRGVALSAQSPLTYTGLVLAKPAPKSLDSVVLSGGLIAELPLGGLRSVFLSGCNTGVGKYLPAEGVQSLQEAFHLAGCPNVIASLWELPDAQTRVLVDGYYEQLWDKKASTLDALCLAQRDLYRNPIKVGVPRDDRGRYPERTPPLYWAGLVHSGIGR